MTDRPDTGPTEIVRDRPTLVALVVFGIAFGAVTGPIGLLVGIGVAVVGYTLGLPYALAAGHVALVAFASDGFDPLSVVVAEAVLLAALLVSLRNAVSPVRTALVVIVSSTALAGVAWLVADSQSVRLAAVTVLALLGVAAYGLHRYELVRLGLVPVGEAEPSPSSDTETTTETASDP